MYWRGKEKDYIDTCRLDSKAVAGRIRVGRGGRTAVNNQSRGVRKALRSHSRVVDVMEHRCYVIARSSNLLFLPPRSQLAVAICRMSGFISKDKKEP